MSRARGYQNLGRLRKAMRQLPEEIKAPVKEAFKAGGQVLLAEMHQRAPERTGNMKKYLAMKVSPDGFSVKVGFIGKRANKKTFYAKFLEFGTQENPAQPFMFPALESTRKEVMGMIMMKVNQAIERGGLA